MKCFKLSWIWVSISAWKRTWSKASHLWWIRKWVFNLVGLQNNTWYLNISCLILKTVLFRISCVSGWLIYARYHCFHALFCSRVQIASIFKWPWRQIAFVCSILARVKIMTELPCGCCLLDILPPNFLLHVLIAMRVNFNIATTHCIPHHQHPFHLSKLLLELNYFVLSLFDFGLQFVPGFSVIVTLLTVHLLHLKYLDSKWVALFLKRLDLSRLLLRVLSLLFQDSDKLSILWAFML